MKYEELLKLAVMAGMNVDHGLLSGFYPPGSDREFLTKFSALIAEECANLYRDGHDDSDEARYFSIGRALTGDIRARSIMADEIRAKFPPPRQ